MDKTISMVLAAGAIGLVLWGITALLQAKSEIARRIRIVIGGAFALWIAAIIGSAGGAVALGITAAVIGAGYWVFSGSKK